jgi:hypothetical protein
LFAFAHQKVALAFLLFLTFSLILITELALPQLEEFAFLSLAFFPLTLYNDLTFALSLNIFTLELKLSLSNVVYSITLKI